MKRVLSIAFAILIIIQEIRKVGMDRLMALIYTTPVWILTAVFVVLFSDVESFIDDGSGIFINYKKGRRPNHNVIRIGNKFIDFGEGFQSRFLTMKTKQLVP